MSRLSLIPLGLLGCEYHPDIVPAGDAASVISGEIVLAIPTPAPGNVVVFVTPAANPMPPYGTGEPIAASGVPSTEFATNRAGMVAAPFSVSNIPDGQYVITALMDIDDNFNPVVDAMAGATCGDLAGAYLSDIVTQSLAPVMVNGGEIGTVVDNVTVVLAKQIPLERPAFTLHGFFDGTAGIDVATVAVAPDAYPYTLQATKIGSEIYELPGPESFGPESCGAIFPLYAPDADADGMFDPHPTYGSQGLFDLWPKIYLQYMGVPVVQPTGAITFDLSGIPEGERWAAENVPHPKYALLGSVLPGETTFRSDLDVMWLPGARRYDAANPEGEIVQDPARIPRGAWSMTMISFTGQTWSVPNTLPAYPTVDDWDARTQYVWLNVY